MRCSLPPHGVTHVFKSYDEFEAHYQKDHSNRCVECRKNFPSAHLLSVHIEEQHDAFAAVKREKGEHTYSCFVEGCERKCMTPQKRRMHLIDKHMYPKNFFFAVTRDGIDGRRSLLIEPGHRRRTSVSTAKEARRRSATLEATQKADSIDDGKIASNDADAKASNHKDDKVAPKPGVAEVNTKERPDIDMEDLTGAMSSLRFVPSSIRFGRGGKSGFSKR